MNEYVDILLKSYKAIKIIKCKNKKGVRVEISAYANNIVKELLYKLYKVKKGLLYSYFIT